MSGGYEECVWMVSGGGVCGKVGMCGAVWVVVVH